MMTIRLSNSFHVHPVIVVQTKVKDVRISQVVISIDKVWDYSIQGVYLFKISMMKLLSTVREPQSKSCYFFFENSASDIQGTYFLNLRAYNEFKTGLKISINISEI